MSLFVELCGSRLNPSPSLMAIPGKDGEILSGAGCSKTFPEVPIEFRVQCGIPESRLNIPSGVRNSRGATGNAGQSRAARCLRIVKFFLFIQSIHLVLQSPDLRQELTS